MPRGVSGFPWRERRLLRFALDEGFAKKLGEKMKAQKGDAAKPEKDGGEEGDAKKEKKNEAVKQDEVKTFVSDIDARISSATQAIEKLPAGLKEKYTENVEQMMVNAVEPADKNRDSVIQASEGGEFAQFTTTVTKQVEQSNAQFKELEKKAEASAEGQKEQQKKDEANLEKRREEVRAKLAEMKERKGEAFPEIAPDSPDRIREAMAQYSSRVAAISEPEKGRVAVLQQAFGLVATLPEKFAEHWKPSGTESAVGGGLVAAGVAASFIPGVNIGVWACAGIGAAVYAGYRAVQLAQLQKEQAELAAEVKKDVAAAKGSLATEQKSIESARAEADKQGQAIGAAPSGVRKKDKQDADTERSRLAKAGMEVRKEKEDATEVKRQLDTQITARVQVAGRAPGEGKPGAEEGKQPPTAEQMIARSRDLQT